MRISDWSSDVCSSDLETQITHKRRLWLYVLSALVMVFLIIPTLIVIPMSFSGSQYLQFPPAHWSLRWSGHYFGSAEWLDATATSLQVAFFTMLLTTPLSVMAAYGLFVSRIDRKRTRLNSSP